MRILFAGAIHDALQAALREQGHDPHAPNHTDWYRAQRDGLTAKQWADATAAEVERAQPDAFVVAKGFHYQAGRLWRVPPAFLWWVSRRMPLVFVSHDDPAATPIILAEGIAHSAHVWLTSCPGIADLFAPRARVVEWWLAWDQRIAQPVPVDESLCVDLAVTGTPYHRPFPRPHYQGGWSGVSRKAYVQAALAAGFTVGIWGPPTWLDADEGGDPSLRPHFRGWLHPDRIHAVHASARVTLATHLVSGHRYDSGRIPFVCGAGGCLLHEHRPGLEDEFSGSVAWFPPGDVDAAIRKLRWLCTHERQRRQMARSAQRKVLARHTWAHRAATLVQEIDRVQRGQ